MKRLFVVIRKRGPVWDTALPLESQRDWNPHAVFMNALQKEGFVILGGPLEGSQEVLLIINAHSADEITQRLTADPWTKLELLQVSLIAPWDLRLGSL